MGGGNAVPDVLCVLTIAGWVILKIDIQCRNSNSQRKNEQNLIDGGEIEFDWVIETYNRSPYFMQKV